MGLSSSISFRASQVDPGTMLSPAPTTASADDAAAFARYLEDSSQTTDSPGDRAAAARDDQRSSASTSTKKKSDSNSSSQDDKPKDEGATTDPTATVLVAPAQPQPTDQKTADPKTDQTPVSAVSDQGGKTPVAPADGKAGEPAAAPLDAKAAAEAGDQKSAAAAATGEAVKGDEKTSVALPQAAAAQAVAQTASVQTGKSDKSEKAAVPATSALPALPATPAVPAQPAHIAAATEAPVNATPDTQAQTGATDPDADLTVKAKEGLGHETASHMAEKADAKDANAAQTTPNAQTATAQAAVPAAATPAAKVASAGDGGVPAISATSSSDGTLSTHLGDLQGAGNGGSAGSNTATVRIGTLPGQTQPTQVPAMAIALQIARNLQKGVNRFDIRLDPPEMGRIDVRMEVKRDGTVSAHLTVEKAQTLDLLQRDARSLQQALSDAGLQANSDSLNFSLRDQNAGNGAQDFAGGTPGSSSTGPAAADETVVSQIYNINLSATGGVDIRV